MTVESSKTHGKNWYDKSYKWLLILPAVLIIFSVFYMISFYNTHGDFINKDVSLTGGTSVSVFDSKVNIEDLEASLKGDFPDLHIRTISDIRTGEQAGFAIETKADVDKIKKGLEDRLGYNLTTENSSIEFSGSSLSNNFYKQILSSLGAAFLLMSWLIFLIFAHSKKAKSIVTIITFLGLALMLLDIGFIKGVSILGILVGMVYGLIKAEKSKNIKWIIFGIAVVSLLAVLFYPKGFLIIFVMIALTGLYIYYSIPSFSVIFAAFADIFMTVVVVNLIGIDLSSAGVVAFLMLIGYSVDTDILLTSRVLRSNEGSVNDRIFGAFKTGMTMTLTAIAAIAVSLIVIYNFSESLKQIFTIILIGLFFDIFNTWITNASMLKWYVEHKEKAK